MGFSRQEWSGLPSPPPGDFPDPGIKTMSLLSPALAEWFFTTRATWEGKKKNKQRIRERAVGLELDLELNPPMQLYHLPALKVDA